jgi:hypothetical protein
MIQYKDHSIGKFLNKIMRLSGEIEHECSWFLGSLSFSDLPSDIMIIIFLNS